MTRGERIDDVQVIKGRGGTALERCMLRQSRQPGSACMASHLPHLPPLVFLQCDGCNSKATAVRRPLLGRLPSTLILHLNRLVFNFDTFLREKARRGGRGGDKGDLRPMPHVPLLCLQINSRMAFPMELNVGAYHVDHPSNAAAASPASAAAAAPETPADGAAAGAAAPADGAAPAATAAAAATPVPQSSYRLAGVVVHQVRPVSLPPHRRTHSILPASLPSQGGAESGHYYSYIRDRATGAWHEYNDSNVRPFSLADLEASTFGGVQETKVSEGREGG